MSRQGWIPDVDHVHAIEREAGLIAERALAAARGLAEWPHTEGAGGESATAPAEPAPGREPKAGTGGRASPAALVAGAAHALDRLGARLRLTFFWGKPSLHRMVMVHNAELLLAAARAAARAEAEVPELDDAGLGDLARDAVGLAGRLLETVPGWENRRLVRIGRRLARRGEAPGPGGIAALALAEKAIARVAALEPGFAVHPDRPRPVVGPDGSSRPGEGADGRVSGDDGLAPA